MRISDWSSDVCSSDLTVMAGMSCGEVSLLAWEILSRGAGDFVTIGEEGVAPAMRLMASGDAGGGAIEAGECAVAGVVALIAATRDAALRARLGLDSASRILLLGSEGATDPEIRSEEHTSELQSLMRISYAVFCLKKKK